MDFGGLGPVTLILLAVAGLVGGVGITALGPGGVLVTIALFGLTGLSPASVAGTAIVTHIATGAIGTAAYVRSGQLRRRRTRRLALALTAAALIGAPLGVLANSRVSETVFGILLGVCVSAIGLLVYLRERRAGSIAERDGRPAAMAAVVPIGLGVAAISGLFGVGGPLLCVPLLLVVGVPMLPALAAAQAQSIAIAGTGAVAYLSQDAIAWPFALLVGLPEIAGVLLGWKLARVLPTHRLRYALAVVLVALGPYLVVQSV